jgi:hypothetical protein
MRAALRGTLVLFVAAMVSSPFLLGQAYPTNGVLFRIAMVESRYGRGTIFSLDVDQREYWITAKHILTGAEHPPYGTVDTTKPVTLRILDPRSDEEHWIAVRFSVIDPGKDIDIVALAPPHIILQNPIANASFDDANILLGGDCSFLGFPFGGGWRATFKENQRYWMPYTKRCNVSSIPGSGIVVLDGINQPRFFWRAGAVPHRLRTKNLRCDFRLRGRAV